MEGIARAIGEHGLLSKSQAELDALKTRDDDGQLMLGGAAEALHARSLFWVGDVLVGMARFNYRDTEPPTHRASYAARSVTGPAGAGVVTKRLVAIAKREPKLGFYGPSAAYSGIHIQEVVPSPVTLGALWELFPWSKPTSLREERTTIGMGDRIGMATAGHIRAARRFDVSPVLAQQSIRELDFTTRSFPDVVSDASFLVFQEGFTRGYGADGDHLKTIPDIDRALSMGMPMITLDLTEVMRPEVADLSDAEVEAAFARLPSDFRARVDANYAGKSIELETGRIEIDAITAHRCAAMYGDALEFSEVVNAHLDARTGGAYDLEISIDETTTPTLPSHHYFISRELEVRGVTVSSLAPRFIGDFQKAIDYIGDLAEFEEQFRVHAEIARATGGYKVSVHSGSDKFSVYPVVGRETQMRLHLKTSGTSWLESLRTIAQCDPPLYRLIHQRAFDYFPEALKSYHITADVDSIADLASKGDAELPSFLEDPNCRQLLHISYGGLLRDPEVREKYFGSLHQNEKQHTRNLREHMRKHLRLLGAPEREDEIPEHEQDGGDEGA